MLEKPRVRKTVLLRFGKNTYFVGVYGGDKLGWFIKVPILSGAMQCVEPDAWCDIPKEIKH